MPYIKLTTTAKVDAAKAQALKEENGGEYVPSVAFQHIIVQEIYDKLRSEDPDHHHGTFNISHINTGSGYSDAHACCKIFEFITVSFLT